MWRFVVLALMVLACRTKEAPAPPPVVEHAPVAAPEPARPAEPVAPVPAAPVPTPVPTPDTSSGGHAPTALQARYLSAYLDLLWVDLTLLEMLRSFPGVPRKARYSAYSYDWRLPNRTVLQTVLTRAKAVAEAVAKKDAADRAVLTYATRALTAWPPIDALATYYAGKRFVDDEFDQGRRDAPLVAAALAELEPLHEELTSAVFAGWRAAAGDTPDSPRAIVGASFEKCLHLGSVVFAAKTTQGKLDAATEAVVDEALSACRRGVGAVSALPDVYRAFDEPLRTAAIKFGNAADSHFSREYAIDDVRTLVTAYIDVWPKLPAEPAERPADR